MISVFYDLETTDLDTVGQILNFAFLAVDDDLHPIESISANIKISRLQLPRVKAILTNRTNVLEHQKVATHSEREAVFYINDFLNRIVAGAYGEPVALIGYNSSSFDLDFLRTVFIRNGINPYHRGVIHKDLLLVSRYLMAFNDTFREKIFAAADGTKVSLRLEVLCKLFGLLDGAQDHESLSDVLLTIELAKVFKTTFGVDVRTFEPYQVKELHTSRKGIAHALAEPLSSQFNPDKRCRTYPAALLDANERYALWIDLEKFAALRKKDSDLKEAIKWKKFAEHIVTKDQSPPADEYALLASEAQEQLKGTDLTNYFTETTCDIEQFIYRIRPNEIDLLGTAMRTGKAAPSFTTDMNQLLKRSWLENSDESLESYALYRYGGKLKLSSSADGETKIHPTLPALLEEIEEASTAASTESNVENSALIDALRTFYLESEIYQAAGTNLMQSGE